MGASQLAVLASTPCWLVWRKQWARPGGRPRRHKQTRRTGDSSKPGLISDGVVPCRRKPWLRHH